MKGLLKKIEKMLDTKTVLSLTAAYVFAVLALKGSLNKDDVMIILVMVFQSFFSYQSNKKKQDDEEVKDDKQ